MKPHPDILATLAPAFEPCEAFASSCTSMRWNPKGGHVPRGFCGATAIPSEVRLVLVCAEPGDPHDRENHEAGGTPNGRLDSVCLYAWNCFANGKDLFHRNVRHILALCWPGLSFVEQMHHTWITDSVLCSARVEGGAVSNCVVRECTSRYLRRQLSLFPGAIVAALGKKAQSRLRQAGVTTFVSAFAAAPPGCNFPEAKASWKEISSRVHQLPL